jgi:hypothetical protein
MFSFLILPSNHGIDDEGITYMDDTIEAFFRRSDPGSGEAVAGRNLRNASGN